MMFSPLDASNFGYNNKFYNTEFENILAQIIACYNLMVSNKVILPNNENLIRDYILYSYLKKQWFKLQYGLTNYLFDPELPENSGRIDLRVMPVNPLIDDDAYFVIECKRLNNVNQNGKTGLNAEYILEGICRFALEKYTNYYNANGMIGFVVEPMDIHRNITSINTLLSSFPQANTTQELLGYNILDGFEYSYSSTHRIINGEIIIYHLMFDFSQNIHTS